MSQNFPFILKANYMHFLPETVQIITYPPKSTVSSVVLLLSGLSRVLAYIESLTRVMLFK